LTSKSELCASTWVSVVSRNATRYPVPTRRVTSVTVKRERHVDAAGLVHAPTSPGIALPIEFDYGKELQPYVEEVA